MNLFRLLHLSCIDLFRLLHRLGRDNISQVPPVASAAGASIAHRAPLYPLIIIYIVRCAQLRLALRWRLNARKVATTPAEPCASRLLRRPVLYELAQPLAYMIVVRLLHVSPSWQVPARG